MHLFDPMLLLPLSLLAVMMLLMWRGNKQRQQAMNDMRSKLVPGVEVMTQAGIFGTLIELDSDNIIAVLEVSPGTNIRVHSQTVATVVEPTVPDDASTLTETDLDDDAATSEITDTDVESTDAQGTSNTDEYDDDRKNL